MRRWGVNRLAVPQHRMSHPESPRIGLEWLDSKPWALPHHPRGRADPNTPFGTTVLARSPEHLYPEVVHRMPALYAPRC